MVIVRNGYGGHIKTTERSFEDSLRVNQCLRANTEQPDMEVLSNRASRNRQELYGVERPDSSPG